MARIEANTFTRRDLRKVNVHKTVEATYYSFVDDGEKYFQINSYGREGRQDAGKTSQTLQIDREMAVSLIRILREEFNI